MGKETKVLQQLQSIEEVISELNLLLPFSEEQFIHSKKEINRIKTLCTKGALIDEALNEQVKDLESTIVNLNLNCLKVAAERLVLDINLDEKANLSITLIKHYLDDFKVKVEEKNTEYLGKLQHIKEKLECENNTKQTKKLIEKISLLEKQINNHKSSLVVSQSEINHLEAAAKGKQKSTSKRHDTSFIPYSMISAKDQQREEDGNITRKASALKMQGADLKLKSQKLSLKQIALVPLCQHDHLIKSWVATYKILDKKADELIKKIDKSPNFSLSSNEKNIKLIGELSELVADLTVLNSHRETLSLSIIGRQGNLVPDLSAAELEVLVKQYRTNLYEVLEKFLMDFLTIDLVENTEKCSELDNKMIQDAVNQLKAFLENLVTSLKDRSLPLEISHLNDFHNKMIQHLGEQQPGFFQKNKEKPTRLTSKLINEFLSNLFDTPAAETHFSILQGVKALITTNNSSLNKENLTKQFIALCNVHDMVKNFSIKSVKDYHTHAQTEAEQHIEINKLYEAHKIELMELMNLLQSKLVLYTNRFDNYPHVKEGYELIRKIELLKEELKTKFKAYTQKRSDIFLLNPQLDSPKQVVALQEETLTSFAEIKNQVAALKALAFNESEALNQLYEAKRGQLKYSLQGYLTNAKTALKIYKPKPDHGIKINKTLHDAEKLVEKLSTEKQVNNLFILERNVERVTSELQQIEREARNQLNDEFIADKSACFIENNKVQTHISISDSNPLKDLLIAYSQQAQNAHQEAEDAYYHLDSVPASNLVQQRDRVRDKLALTKQHQELYFQTKDKAQTIEKRLASEEYKISLLVINTLRMEYLRILGKTREKSKEAESYEGFNDNFKTLLMKKKLTHEQITHLDAIDFRLVKLWTMYNDFNQINEAYINIELDFTRNIAEQKFKMLNEILRAELNEAILKYPDYYNELILIQELSQIPENPEPIAQTLRKIDPKLAYSWNEMIATKAEIDSPFSNVPNKEYSKLLKNKVNKYIHNSHMEDISDGKLNEFVQWIRKNVFKPIQTLQQSIFGSDNKYWLFTTFGASKTEAELVKVGNTAYQQLAAPVA